MIGGIAISVLILVLLSAFYAWQKRSLNFMKRCESFNVKFHDAVRPLLRDPETPEAIVEMLGFLNQQVANKKAAREFVMFAFSGAMTEPPSSSARKRVSAMHDFFKARPELERPYYEAVAFALLSIAFRSPIAGRFMMVWLSGGRSFDDETVNGRDPRNESAAFGFRRYVRSRTPLGNRHNGNSANSACAA